MLLAHVKQGSSFTENVRPGHSAQTLQNNNIGSFIILAELVKLTRLPFQEREIAQLLGLLDLVALLFSLGTGYWLSVSCFQSPRMGSLVGYWLIVERGVVPGTMGLGCFSQSIVGSPGSAPQARHAEQPGSISQLSGLQQNLCRC